MAASEPPRCMRCAKVIGVYEPLVVRSRGEVRETSLAAEPDLPVSGAEHFHLACWSVAVS